MDVEKGRLEKLKEVDNVHLITGLVKMFFKWEFVFLIILDQKSFSRDLKEPIISEDLLKKLSTFVQVKQSALMKSILVYSVDTSSKRF